MPGIRNTLFATSFFKEKTYGFIEATEAVEAVGANEVRNVAEVKKSLITWIPSSFCIFWGQRDNRGHWGHWGQWGNWGQWGHQGRSAAQIIEPDDIYNVIWWFEKDKIINLFSKNFNKPDSIYKNILNKKSKYVAIEKNVLFKDCNMLLSNM